MSVLDSRGATLVEVLLAATLAIASVAMLSTLFPKASVAMTNNRRRWLASNEANRFLQEIKVKPYALIPVTTQTCDCKNVDWSALPISSTATIDSANYTSRVCIGLVERQGTDWTPVCADADLTNDTGLKNIRVRVAWTIGNDAYSTEMESMVAR